MRRTVGFWMISAWGLGCGDGVEIAVAPDNPLLRGGGVPEIGQEVSMPVRLAPGDEHRAPICDLIEYGQRLVAADWTWQEGGGRPQTTGVGSPLVDPTQPLVFPRNFNRVSGPDSNSCAGCHNKPYGIPGGGGDIVANVFVLGQRFDFATFDGLDTLPTRGAVDEAGQPVTLQTIANERATVGMYGSGFIEMLSRQMTADLQALRDGLAAGDQVDLETKGVTFGSLSREVDGTWDVSGVEGLSAQSTETTGTADPPNLIVRPFHQAGAVVSLREFTNNAFNHHHGIQTVERFGAGLDPDGDGFVDEMSIADVTAASIYQATMMVPGQVLPSHAYALAAVANGEQQFADVGCAACHLPTLPLDDEGWIFSEPNPYNPPGNLAVGDEPSLFVDLTDPSLPGPRPQPVNGTVWVAAFTDLKLHDITDGPGDPNAEPLDMQHAPGSAEFFDGNRRFLTKKLWGAANEAPFFHHGKFTTMRQAIGAHGGEAAASRAAFDALSDYDRDSIIEYLKTLQVLPPPYRCH